MARPKIKLPPMTSLLKPVLIFFVLMYPVCSYACDIVVNQQEAEVLAEKIWRNETGGSWDKLVWWNDGEQFASLGLGHFIWYPTNKTGPFDESFPKLLKFLQENNIELPLWLQNNPDCPWQNKADFLEKNSSPQVKELNEILKSTWSLQIAFMLQRLQLSQTVITQEQANGDSIAQRFCRLVNTPEGRYALMDYVNFKGEGTKLEERYKGEGWGLKQVLENMTDADTAYVDFSKAAEKVLRRRVKNSPPLRNERRWLNGWIARVKGYQEELVPMENTGDAIKIE